MNTAFVFILLLVITFVLYLTDNVLGGPSGIYDKLAAISLQTPVVGNAGGSYLTLASLEGGSFFSVLDILINLTNLFRILRNN